MPTGIYNRKNKLSKEELKRRACERTKRWYKSKPEIARTTKLMRAYGITHNDYLSLKEGINCFICNKECASGRSLAVDHDHSNGVVRGLLCINCNKGIGNFKENIELLEKAIEYINNYRECLKEQGYAADEIRL